MNLFLVSTISCILEFLVPVLIKYLTVRLCGATKQHVELRNDMINLKQEMASLSMVDEFPKYAKLQRKYNKLEAILNEKVNSRMAFRIKVQLLVTYAFRMVNGFLLLILVFLYTNEPVIILPKGILWPIQNLLSWPSYREDCISLLMWLMISRLAVSCSKNIEVS